MNDDKPKYATGGPVNPGRAYWVGEHGPEPLVLPANVAARMDEIRRALEADLGIDTPPCDCVTTETTPEGQHTPRTFNIDMSACDKHRTGGN